MIRKKPTKAELNTFWSVFEAQQQRKREALQRNIAERKQQRTIPPENYITEQEQKP